MKWWILVLLLSMASVEVRGQDTATLPEVELDDKEEPDVEHKYTKGENNLSEEINPEREESSSGDMRSEAGDYNEEEGYSLPEDNPANIVEADEEEDEQWQNRANENLDSSDPETPDFNDNNDEMTENEMKNSCNDRADDRQDDEDKPDGQKRRANRKHGFMNQQNKKGYKIRTYMPVNYVCTNATINEDEERRLRKKDLKLALKKLKHYFKFNRIKRTKPTTWQRCVDNRYAVYTICQFIPYEKQDNPPMPNDNSIYITTKNWGTVAVKSYKTGRFSWKCYRFALRKLKNKLRKDGMLEMYECVNPTWVIVGTKGCGCGGRKVLRQVWCHKKTGEL